MGRNDRALSGQADVAGSRTRSTTDDGETAVEGETTVGNETAVGDVPSGRDAGSATETHDSDTGSKSATVGSDDESGEPGWLTDPWYRTRAGVTMLLIDVGLIVVLASTTLTTVVSEFATVVPPQTPGHVPWFVYAFSALGGLAYVFTALLEDFQSETKSLFRYNLRVPAALPLGAGVWILSDVLIGADAAPPLVLGLAFLSGLYVNLAYERFGALARRFLPDSTTDESAEASAVEAETGDGSDGGPEVTLDEQRDADDQPSKRDPASGTPTD